MSDLPAGYPHRDLTPDQAEKLAAMHDAIVEAGVAMGMSGIDAWNEATTLSIMFKLRGKMPPSVNAAIAEMDPRSRRGGGT